MTLNDIVQSAQGGKAVDNLAAQYGLAPAAAEKAVQAMIAALSAALQATAANPARLGAVLKELASGAHIPSFAEPGQPAGATARADDALSQMFGSPQAIEAVVQHVSQVSGVSAETVEAMLPAVASMLLGGLAHAMASQGLSGVLGELAEAASAPGGLGSALQPAQGESSGGLLGSLFGSVFGGGHAAPGPQTAALAGGLATLSAMFVSGVQVAETHQASLAAVAQSFIPPTPGAGV